MKPTQLLADEDAVSPVIGVILMVAITVIMAAIVGAFVLSLQAGTAVAPTASFDTTTDDTSGDGAIDEIQIRHRAGEVVQTDNLRVRVPRRESAVGGGADSIAVGDTIDVELDGTNSGPAGDQILLVWSESTGGESTILTSHTFTQAYRDDTMNATVT